MSKHFTELIYDSLMVTQSLPQKELLAYQAQFLERIVGHAFRTVPYYQQHLRPYFRDNGRLDLDRWHAVPILSREVAWANFDNLKSAEVPKGHGASTRVFSSGTSGKPIKVLRTQRARHVEHALLGRFYAWHKVDGSFPLVIIRGDVLGEYPEGRKGKGLWVPKWLAPANAAGYMWLKHPLAPELQLEFLKRHAPLYLNTQPSNLKALAMTALADAKLRCDIRGVFTIGELVTAEHRELARAAFGCEIFDNYSASESGTLAHQCVAGAHHINVEHVHVEVLKDDNTPSAPEETGRIVVTPLGNYAMPLIRYEQGDKGSIGGTCSCGLTLPKLNLTVGRERNLFRFSDGTQVLSLLRPGPYMSFFPITQWQVAQVGPEALEIRFASSKTDAELDFARLTAAVKAYFKRDLEVRYKRLDALPVGKTGKLNETVREFD